MRRAVLLVVVLASLCAAAPASAAPPSTALGHTCTDQAGVRFCPTNNADPTGASLVRSFPGSPAPLDADVTLPPTSAGDGPFPTIVMLHGYGGSKTAFEATTPEGDGLNTYHYNNNYYAKQGYAVLNYTVRGFGASCGKATPPGALPDCAANKGYIHLIDQRYEIHDTQYLLGKLVDEGITQPTTIGSTGISYGGGQTMQLAFLRDQIRNLDNSLTPWKSPNGTPMRLAAGWPRWPWSSLPASLLPNGRFLDYDNRTLTATRAPFGVAIQSYIAGLFASGGATGTYAPPGTDPTADLTTNFAAVNAGEPYSANPTAVTFLNELDAFHSSLGLFDRTPSPLLLQSGWTDDLFPPSESLRTYNLLRSRDPNAPVSLQFGDLGHSRGSVHPNTEQTFQDQGAAFFEQRVKGSGSGPAPGSATAFGQGCPRTGNAPGPITESSFAALHPGQLNQLFLQPKNVTVPPEATTGNEAGYDPIGGTSDACKTSADTPTNSGAAVYTFKSQGFTLLGLPTVIAAIKTTGANGQLDSRLWDVGPDGQQTLISRGAYRLEDNQTGNVALQLHGNGYTFAAGHTVKLELLARDAPYYRASNGTFSVAVAGVFFSVPTRDRPGSRPGIVAPVDLANAKPPIAPKLGRMRIKVRPRVARVGGKAKRFRFTVTQTVGTKKNQPVSKAKVRFGKSKVTSSKGKALLKRRFRKPGRYTATVRKAGQKTAKVRVRVVRARSSRR